MCQLLEICPKQAVTRAQRRENRAICFSISLNSKTKMETSDVHYS